MMRESPPRKLVELLERLGLATETHFRRVAGSVQRLARELPLFESVWVDALAQARVITSFQAQQLNAGRGESLRVGPYVIEQSVAWPAYATAYRAHEHRSREPVHLVVLDRSIIPHGDSLGKLENLADRTRLLDVAGLAPAIAAGGNDAVRWVASRWSRGRTAAEWMVHHGRFSPDIVWEFARQMLVSLSALEKQGLCHGDISAQATVLTPDGRAVLLLPGLRAIVRPAEGYAHAELRPEAYDYLAPERVADGTPPTVASDIFACGCLWWHMLTGRPPLTGGSSLAKLRRAQAARIADIRSLAPRTPAEFAAMVMACVAAEPQRRPESMARLAAMLGSVTPAGRIAVVRTLARAGRPVAAWIQPRPRQRRGPSYGPAWMVAATCLVIAIGTLFGSNRHERPVAISHQDTVSSATSARASGASSPQEATAHLPAVGVQREVVGTPASPDDRTATAVSYEATERETLVLSGSRATPAQSLRLRSGMVVRGTAGQRSPVVVPADGWAVAADGVRFENIDFTAAGEEPVGSEASGPGETRTLLQLQAARAEFRGCSFQVASQRRTAAIRWNHPAGSVNATLSLPSGRVHLINCLIRGAAVGIDCRTVGAITIDAENTLCLGVGVLVCLDHFPVQEEPTAINVAQLTLRDCGSLLECRYGNLAATPGAIAIRSQQCVLSTASHCALLLFTGHESPTRLLENIQWTGQGSLVAPEAAIAGWQAAPGHVEAVDDSGLAIAGLVRSAVGFAAAADEGTAASRAVRWQVPLRSPDPPGVDVDRLPDFRGNGERRL